MSDVQISTQRIDHLGIVAGICQEIDLIGQIDRQVGDKGRKVSVGQAIQAMVLNGLGFVNRPLYLTPEFYANKPVAWLIGAGIVAEDLNDDCLGRALDWVVRVGVDGDLLPCGRSCPKGHGHREPLCARGHERIQCGRGV